MRREDDGRRRAPLDVAKDRLREAEGAHDHNVVSDRIAAEQSARLAALVRDPAFGSRPHVAAPKDGARWREVSGAHDRGRHTAPAGAEGASALGHRRAAGDEELGPAESPDADVEGRDGDCVEPTGGEAMGELPGPGARMDRTERTAAIQKPARATEEVVVEPYGVAEDAVVRMRRLSRRAASEAERGRRGAEAT